MQRWTNINELPINQMFALISTGVLGKIIGKTKTGITYRLANSEEVLTVPAGGVMWVMV